MSTPHTGTWELERPNLFEIDLRAVAHNARLLRSQLSDATIFAALKADGYGYGAEAVAHTLVRNGINGFSMVSIGAAVRLRETGISSPILLYPGVPFTPAAVDAIQGFDLIPTIIDKAGADRLAALTQHPVTAYIKVDVGLERFGVQAEQITSLLEHIGSLERIRVGGVYAHLHLPPGGGDPGYIKWQQGRFHKAAQITASNGLSAIIVMSASTGLLTHRSDEQLTAADPGRWFFGLIDTDGTTDDCLRPAFVSVKSRLVAVKEVDRQYYVASSPFGRADVRRIGIMPVGQVDGVERITVGRVLVRGRPANIVGQPSIEHSRIDLSAIPEAAPGDTVVLVGDQGASQISPREVAAHHGVPSPCLLALRVGPAFRREYIGL